MLSPDLKFRVRNIVTAFRHAEEYEANGNNERRDIMLTFALSRYESLSDEGKRLVDAQIG